MTGRTTRPKAPPRWQQRMSSAGTPAEELTVAYDRLRSSLARLCRRQYDPVAQAESATLAAACAREAVSALLAVSERLESRKPERVPGRDTRLSQRRVTR